MSFFNLQNGVLHAEHVALPAVAEAYGTPSYVYSRAAFEQQWRALDTAFGEHSHLICYAVKANSNLAVLNILAQLGSGFDIVSSGELKRVLAAGGDPAQTVFSGVAKSEEEIRLALSCGNTGVRCINVESLAELYRVQKVAAELDTMARIGVRVNPDVDARTHPYIATGLETAKFGLTINAALEAYALAQTMPNISIYSMACHIGSQITELQPFADAVSRIADLSKRLQVMGVELQQLDLGGGLGIDYQGETPPSAAQYVSNLLKQLQIQNIDISVAIEPGRFIAGNSGILLTKVEYLKHTPTKNFAVVNAGMNDLLRPSLYQAEHRIDHVVEPKQEPLEVYDVVGPVCESADVLGFRRTLHLKSEDLLAIRSAGAYAFAMASNYNTRGRPAEIMVDGDQMHLIRRRETFADMVATEQMLVGL